MRTSQTHRILVIDDNADIHNDFRKILAADDGPPEHSVRLATEILGPNAALESLEPRFEVDCVCQGEDGLAEVTRAAPDRSALLGRFCRYEYAPRLEWH